VKREVESSTGAQQTDLPSTQLSTEGSTQLANSSTAPSVNILELLEEQVADNEVNQNAEETTQTSQNVSTIIELSTEPEPIETTIQSNETIELQKETTTQLIETELSTNTTELNVETTELSTETTELSTETTVQPIETTVQPIETTESVTETVVAEAEVTSTEPLILSSNGSIISTQPLLKMR